jgi:uncharacterized membrane protein YidH (DUF202 family)
MSKRIMATLGNLAIFLIVLLLILHITGYIEVRANTREGFYYKKLGTQGIVMIVMIIILAICGIVVWNKEKNAVLFERIFLDTADRR